MFFGGNVAATLNAQDTALGWNWIFWDQVLKRVVQELGDNSLLASALIAPPSTLPIGLAVATNVDFCVREVPAYLYILACKREGTTIQATFTGLPSWATTGELLYESPRTVNVQSGQFTDWFAPFEVHAYRFLNTTTNAGTGQLLLYEPFDYSNIGSPVSSNTPANWTFNGSGANDLNVAAGSLSYTGWPASVGNSVTNGGAGLGVRRLYSGSVNSGVLYFSALFRVNDLGYGAWNGAASQVGALTATDNQSFRLAVMVKSNSPSGYVIGVQKGGTGASSTFDTTEHQAGETVLLVGKYDFTSSPNPVSLWINPSSFTFGGPEQTNGFISATTGVDGYAIDRFNMRQNTASSVPGSMQWDELRIGTSWSIVTALPPPTVTLLTNVQKLPTGAFQFTYTNSSPNLAIYASTNLTDWASLGSATQVSPGLYQFTDTAATNYPRRFYQLRLP
jgi:hypothetical protein